MDRFEAVVFAIAGDGLALVYLSMDALRCSTSEAREIAGFRVCSGR